MSKNPLVNALSATAYITLVASVMFYMPKRVDATPSVMVPVFVLSLFVLSAALMGYFFLYQPIQFLIEGKKEDATKLFLTTVAVFAGVTCVMAFTWYFLNFAV